MTPEALATYLESLVANGLKLGHAQSSFIEERELVGTQSG